METINIITLGASGVGKTSLIKRITANTFDLDYETTIGVDFTFKEKEYKNKSFKSIKYLFWDTMGQEKLILWQAVILGEKIWYFLFFVILIL